MTSKLLDRCEEYLQTYTMGGPVYRVDVDANGKKIRDYAKSTEYYSLGDKYKLEIDFNRPISLTIKDKTFNKVIFTEMDPVEIMDMRYALESMAKQTRHTNQARATIAKLPIVNKSVTTHNFLQHLAQAFTNFIKVH